MVSYFTIPYFILQLVSLFIQSVDFRAICESSLLTSHLDLLITMLRTSPPSKTGCERLNVSLKDNEGSGDLVSDYSPHYQTSKHWHAAIGAVATSLHLCMMPGIVVWVLVAVMHLSFDTVSCQTTSRMPYLSSASSSPPHPHLTSLWCQMTFKRPGTHSSTPYCLILLLLSFVSPTHLCLMFKWPFHPFWFICPPHPHLTLPNDVQTAWDAFLHPLLPHSASPLLCFTHPPSFNIPTTFPPPSDLFCSPHPRLTLPNNV